jgi:hypothetical protein
MGYLMALGSLVLAGCLARRPSALIEFFESIVLASAFLLFDLYVEDPD